MSSEMGGPSDVAGSAGTGGSPEVSGIPGVSGSASMAWQLQATSAAYRAFLTIESRTYRLPDGRTTRWDVLAGGRTVAVVALAESEQVVLARQFRPGPGEVLDELPGGMVDPDEEVLAAAGRELLEETGYAAAELEVVGRSWLAGFSTIERYAVLARGCRRVAAPAPSADEVVEPVLRPLPEFVTQVRAGALTDADAAWACLDRLALLGQPGA